MKLTNREIIFRNILKEAWNHRSGYEPNNGNHMVGGKWSSSDKTDEYEKEIEVYLGDGDKDYYLVGLIMDAYLSQGYDESVNYSWCEVEIDEDTIELQYIEDEYETGKRDLSDPKVRDKLFTMAKEKLLADKDYYFEDDFIIDDGYDPYDP